MNETGEYKIRPYKGLPGERMGEPCVHPVFSDSLKTPDPFIFPKMSRSWTKQALKTDFVPGKLLYFCFHSKIFPPALAYYCCNNRLKTAGAIPSVLVCG
jgi:hypothetical protein